MRRASALSVQTTGGKTQKGSEGRVSRLSAMGMGGSATSGDLRNLLVALIDDVARQRIDPRVLGAVSNASGKIVQIITLEMRLGVKGERNRHVDLTENYRRRVQ